MRLVLCLTLAVVTAVLVYACGETEEATLSESPGATTPAASGSATPTGSPSGSVTAAPSPSPGISPPTTPTSAYDWVPPTPEVSRDDLGPNWYVPAFGEDEGKTKIAQQTLNGILIGPDPDLFPEIGACGGDLAIYIHPDEIEGEVQGSPIDIRPTYLPTGVTLDSAEAAACGGLPVNLVERYQVESRPDPGGTQIPLWSGGSITISRTLTTESQFPVTGVAERLYPATIGGQSAIVVEPLTPLGYDIGLGSAKIVVADAQTMTSISGHGLPFGELLAIADSLWSS